MSSNGSDGQPALGFVDGLAQMMLWSRDNKGDPSLDSSSTNERRLALWRRDVIDGKLRGTLTEDQEYLLEQINFRFPLKKGSVFESTFDQQLAAMRKWKKDTGNAHLLIGRSVKVDDIDVGNFIHNLRKMKQKKDKGQNTLLTEEMIESLNKEGMIWDDVAKFQWNMKYGELKAYIAKEGHPNVPQSKGEHYKLGQWVSNQRKSYNNGKLSQECVTKLNAVDFKWKLRGN